ncbi:MULTISPECIES: hypothetical protein [Chryseobacterium]|jgi:hypothetical protein|uniref:Uncharacterized protein n=2 Tax=Chryseobacterium TaxID=59732 RepID=A0A1N7LTZ8_9FLAO|nr:MULTISPECIES: hypothetical protein [Chryseobacterium]MDO3425947.1 hypothetical protein [Chryseobacterium sp. APV1]PTT74751.1 hypothetical protein DBR25_10025 [Chryseobacterium sp. HMWF001]PVV54860.1 hypothetical protein DD829_16705 [Chryseobacterium sp. HMWF035]SIS77310.1 hypothetical protein SAMN05421785_102498 [Chryseobacterium gambrini]
MKFKITIILLGLFCVLLNSCRETEDLNYPNTVSDNITLQKDSKKEKDSSENQKDPPIKGTHWKTQSVGSAEK